MNQLFVKTILGTTLTVEIDSIATINGLKQVIFTCGGIPPCHQRLVIGCREYSDGTKLSELCVAGGQSMTLHSRLMGGNLKWRKKPLSNPRIMPVTWWFGFGLSYQDGRVA